MPFRGTPGIQATAILVILLAGGLPTTVSAQEIMAKGFSAIDARAPVEQNTQPKQLLTARPPTFHQTVRMQRQRRRSTPFFRDCGVTFPQLVYCPISISTPG